jgi:hypothetical protein
MRQYKLFYKRGKAPQFGVLQPGVHEALYSNPDIQAAIEFMRINPFVEGLALRFGDEIVNVAAFEQEAEAPNAFQFVEPTAELSNGDLTLGELLNSDTVVLVGTPTMGQTQAVLGSMLRSPQVPKYDESWEDNHAQEGALEATEQAGCCGGHGCPAGEPGEPGVDGSDEAPPSVEAAWAAHAALPLEGIAIRPDATS